MKPPIHTHAEQSCFSSSRFHDSFSLFFLFFFFSPTGSVMSSGAHKSKTLVKIIFLPKERKTHGKYIQKKTGQNAR